MEIIDLQNATALRTVLYRNLTRWYSKEIDHKCLLEMNSTLAMFADYNKGRNDNMLEKGIEIIKNFTGKHSDLTLLVDELALKYTTIFLNVSPNGVVKHVHPYESVYLSPNKLVMQDQRDEVLEFYAEQQMGVADNFKEPEDHIAIELAFLQELNKRICKELANNNMDDALDKFEVHSKFMQQHLLKWVHLLGRDLIASDPNGFYAGLANITIGFVKEDYMYVEEVMDYIKTYN
jgi:TorA-specific chaperone